MSVEFVTDIGYGYILNHDQVREIENKTMGEIFDYLYCIDGYVDSCKYFFGIKLHSLYPGDYLNLATVTELSGESAKDITAKLIAVLKDCSLNPEHPDWSNPQVYVLHRMI